MSNLEKDNESKTSDLKESDSEPHLFWNNNIDNLIAQWCDHAKCFEWMHTHTIELLNI